MSKQKDKNMKRCGISGMHANDVAEMSAEELMNEGLDELNAEGIFPEMADGIILTEDEILERDWPFDDDYFGFNHHGRCGAGGLVSSSEFITDSDRDRMDEIDLDVETAIWEEARGTVVAMEAQLTLAELREQEDMRREL